jgi:uncharacterized protein YbjT (DUF2867 family)
MHVVLFGATGMVGHGALTALLEDPQITGVTALTRRPTGRDHPKLSEIRHHDFTDYRELGNVFGEADATLFCLGSPSVGLTEPAYARITVDYAVAAAEAARRANPEGLFVYVSANRADSASRIMWIRVKGRAEEALQALSRTVVVMRPGFIRPRRGARPATRKQRVAYALLSPFYPLLRLAFPAQTTTTDAIGYAMIEVLHAPAAAPHCLDNAQINHFADRGRRRLLAAA